MLKVKNEHTLFKAGYLILKLDQIGMTAQKVIATFPILHQAQTIICQQNMSKERIQEDLKKISNIYEILEIERVYCHSRGNFRINLGFVRNP